MLSRHLEKAITVLKRNLTSRGLIRASASQAQGGWFPEIWVRDALICCLGASYSQDEKLIEAAETTIRFVSKYQQRTGQLPNRISVDGQVCDFARGGTVDPTLWYPIATLNHYNVVHDRQFLKTHYPKVKRALAWLDCLDQNRDFLLETNEGSDWMDSLLRQGSLYVQALYYGSLRAADEMGAELGVGRTYTTRAERVKENINLLYWPEEKNRGAVEQRLACRQEDFDLVLRAGTLNYYYGEVRLGWYEWRFYSLANVLTVLFDIADGIKKESIFTHISRAKISTPYPLKVTWPPIPAGDKHWAVHFRPKRGFEWICREGNHQNGGIWPFVGGFYVTALKKERRSEAHRELEKLAQACRLGKRGEWEFLEWLNAEGEVVADHPSSFQSWSCATSLLAHTWKPAKSLLRLE